MKTLKIIGTTAVIAGIFLAGCTADGSKHEIALRLSGVVLMAIGAIVLRKLDQEKEGDAL